MTTCILFTCAALLALLLWQALVYTQQVLSGSTNGRGIKIVATASLGTTVHTAVSGTGGFDEIYLWLVNTDTVARTVVVEWGGTTVPDDHLVDTYSLPANSAPVPIAQGLRLNNAVVVRVYASAANKVIAFGYVNNLG